MNTNADEDRNETWLSSAIAGALFGLIIACCACLPLIAPYGVADLFSSTGQQGHQPRIVSP